MVNQNALFQFSLNNVLEIIVIFDGSGKIVYTNQMAENQLEYSGSLCGRTIVEVFPNEFEINGNKLVINGKTDGSVRQMMAYRGNRTCFPTEVKLFCYEAAENEYPSSCALCPTFSLHKGQALYICSGFNTTARNFLEKKANQADQEAEDALKVRSEFIANVTHELRTPVNGILGNVQELLTIEKDAGKLKLLHLVERGCKDMHSLINNILDFSKLEAGKFVIEPQKFQFRNMIDYVKGNYNNRIIEKGLEFSISISPEIPEYIVGDELRIVQVLNNLVSNAYKFTSVGGIHMEVVKTAQAGRRMELFFMVIDTGIGIAKSDHDKLFKSFSQIDASISRKYGGTGLGLNICKQLVELMGGNIHVESDLGKGTTFSFNIWVEIPEDMCEECQDNKEGSMNPVFSAEGESGNTGQALLYKLQSLTDNQISDKIWQYGEPENKTEIDKKMSKLILSVEMDNWEKAEMFAEAVKQLVEEAPREIKSAAFRMKMAVQKGDYEKATAAYEVLKGLLQ